MRLRSALLMLASVVVVAGCGGHGGAGPNAKSDAGVSATSPMPARDQLKVVVPSKTNSIDPLIAADITEVQVMYLTAGTLFTLNYEGNGATPGLAASGKLAADARSYALELKSGLTFSDGTPLTSADVVATFQRALSFESNVYAGEFQPITGVKAITPTTVEFTFARPYPSFQTMISFPEFAILKKEEIGANGSIPDVPTMAGQYVIDGDVHANTFALTRNPSYAGATPSVEKLSVSVVPDAAGRLAQVRGAQADLATDVGAQALAQTMSGASAHATPSMIAAQLAFSNNAAPLTDVKVRRAISIALDRESISKIAWAGAMPPNAGLLPSGSTGADPGNTNPDPSAARELLKGTACESGCSLSLLLDGSSQWQSAAATIMEQNLKSIGVDVSIQPLETITLNNRLSQGDYQLALGYFGTYADVPDATPQYCLSYSYGFNSCYTDYRSPEAEAAVDKAVTATDEAALKDAYDGVNAIFRRDAPLATLSDFAAVWAISDGAKGYASIGPTAMISIAPLKD